MPQASPRRRAICDDVGQVELALGVVAVDARRADRSAWRAATAMMPPLHEADRALLRASPRPPRRCARACRRRRARAGRRRRDRPAASPRPATAAAVRRRSASRRASGSGGHERRVAEQHQEIADIAVGRQTAGEGAEPGADRVAGAERRILHDALRRRDETARPRPCRGPITTTVAAGASGRSASSTCAIIGRPATWCRTLGSADFIRVPLPAARMMAAKPDWLIDCSKRDN